MEKKLKVGIVGVSNMGAKHAKIFNNIEGVKVAALCDIDKEKTDKVAEKFGAKPYADFLEMLKDIELDIVDVCTREWDRPLPLIESLKAGKHVYCEKPLAGTKPFIYTVNMSDIDSGINVIKAWRKSGKKGGIGWNYRFASHLKKLKEIIISGEAGEPVMINAHCHLDCWTHVVDLVIWLNGNIKEISAHISGPENNPNRTASLLFENGSIGTLTGQLAHGYPHPLIRIEYIGTKERIAVDGLIGSVERRVNRNNAVNTCSPVWDRGIKEQFEDTFKESINAFVEAVKNNTEPPVTLLDGLRELEIDAHIIEAGRTGKVIKVKRYE